MRISAFRRRGAGAGASERAQRNKAMRALLRDLADVDGLADALHAARYLPPPRYADDAWTFVEALLEVLPQVVAHLTLVFRAAGAIDFTQGTLAALEALGDADRPSELLLRLDCRIRHLLVDEFQDTSYMQLDLIRRLTAGWEPGDGRTLFAVGDPMQSIYRFRGAEVRLFVAAQDTGRIGELPIENIVLRRNFRSQAQLVEWTNGVFPGVLGMRSDPWRGVVGFVPAAAVRDAAPGNPVTFDVLRDAEDEARAVVGHITAALAEGAEEVAVLVRARAHLESLLPALRAAGIPVAAVELDALGERVAVQDLVSLTHALIQPADRLAWLAVLRAPWCGLMLRDLFAVVAAADARRDGSIAGLMHVPETITGLSADGRTRLARVAPVLSSALDARRRAGVAARVRAAWLALGGGATLTKPIDLDAVERFLSLVADHEVAGDVPDWPALIDSLARLYAEPDTDTGARVQIMTLHRAKGLEFDTVILPGLARARHRGGGRNPAMAPAATRSSASADEGAGRRYGSRLCLSQTTRRRRRKRRTGAAALRRLHAREATIASHRRARVRAQERWPALMEGAARRLGAGQILARAWQCTAAAGCGGRLAATVAAGAPPWPLAGVLVDARSATRRAGHAGDGVTARDVAFRLGP